jgi:hypothetical protein
MRNGAIREKLNYAKSSIAKAKARARSVMRSITFADGRPDDLSPIVAETA